MAVSKSDDVVIVEAVRSPVGRRNGGLSSLHPADLLGKVQKAVFERSGVSADMVGQVVTGCVSQVGAQAYNIGRLAWLGAGLPMQVANTTLDTQCGSSQQATSLAAALVRSGDVDVALASGVEVMSRVPIGSSGNPKWGLGIPYSDGFVDHYERTSQFEAAERIADRWSVTREDADRFGLSSQRRAQAAWAEDRFAGQYIEIAVAELDEDGRPTGESRVVARDEGLRETTLEKLAALKPVGRENGVHTAGNSSQISDGAAAVLMMTARKAAELGLKARARIVDSVLVGTDPTLMLTGPIDATRKLLARTGLALDDIDLFEVNEAFASVVIAWSKEIGADLDKTNPNGGGIALGHPLGGTGCILVTKALYELDRTSSQFALVSMCCGGGLATGTVIERLD